MSVSNSQFGRTSPWPTRREGGDHNFVGAPFALKGAKIEKVFYVERIIFEIVLNFARISGLSRTLPTEGAQERVDKVLREKKCQKQLFVLLFAIFLQSKCIKNEKFAKKKLLLFLLSPATDRWNRGYCAHLGGKAFKAFA